MRLLLSLREQYQGESRTRRAIQIQDALVDALSLSGFGSNSMDADGSYIIGTGLATGTYNVTVTATGYISQGQTGINMIVSHVTANVDFQLVAKPSGGISDQILTDSSPIPEFHALTLLGILAVSAIAFVVGKMRPLRKIFQANLKTNMQINKTV